MKYYCYELQIIDLINLIKTRKIDLSPSYQRNFIWNRKDQQMLIDSILKGYPLPNFFIYKKNDGNLEMVDGQQRARTIYRFYENEFKNIDKKEFKDINQSYFNNYKLVVIELYELSPQESLEQFYTLVNKQGKHLNPAEVNRAEYHDSKFMVLVQNIMEMQQLIDLDIFSYSTINRMNDRSLIEEVMAYLFYGITDKRKSVERLFEVSLSDSDVSKKRIEFEKILNRITILNGIRAINTTRFKQRNDFYSLCCFINEHINDSIELLKTQYEILVYFNDKEYIRPTNNSCETFKNYALNCVTQSNSKEARIRRLEILNHILYVKEINDNKDIYDIIAFLSNEYPNIEYKEVGGYKFIDLNKLL